MERHPPSSTGDLRRWLEGRPRSLVDDEDMGAQGALELMELPHFSSTRQNWRHLPASPSANSSVTSPSASRMLPSSPIHQISQATLVGDELGENRFETPSGGKLSNRLMVEGGLANVAGSPRTATSSRVPRDVTRMPQPLLSSPSLADHSPARLKAPIGLGNSIARDASESNVTDVREHRALVLGECPPRMRPGLEPNALQEWRGTFDHMAWQPSPKAWRRQVMRPSRLDTQYVSKMRSLVNAE